MLVDGADMSASMILHEKLVGKLEHALLEYMHLSGMSPR